MEFSTAIQERQLRDVSDSLARIYGQWYLDGSPMAVTLAERTAFEAWVWEQFRAIPCPVRFTEQSMTLAECKETFEKCGILRVSVAHNSHPFWSESTNAMFRAIHDWHHLVIGADDSLEGEIKTYRHACLSAPVTIRWILRSEIVLQAAACILTGKFQPQKLVWMPN